MYSWSTTVLPTPRPSSRQLLAPWWPPFPSTSASAVRCDSGFATPRAHGYANVVQLDSDGQHDPANVRELLARLDGADIVIGARFAGAGDYSVRGPRRWAMSVLAWVLSRLTRTRLTDTTSGFKANGPRAVDLFARDYPAEYLGDTIEALVSAAKAGLTVAQVPVAMRPRLGGTPSQNSLGAVSHLARAFLALGFALLRPTRNSGAFVELA